MLNAFRIQRLRLLADIELRLSPLTILAGPNAVGKSSVLLAASLLCETRNRPPRDIFRDRMRLGELRSRSLAGPLVLGAEGEDSTGPWRLQWQLEGEPQTGPRRDARVARLEVQRAGAPAVEPPGERWGMAAEESPDTAGLLPTAVFARLDPTKLALPSYSDELEPRMGPEGADLASTLAALALHRPDSFEALQEELRGVVPTVRRLRFRRARLRRRLPHRLEAPPPSPYGRPGEGAEDFVMGDELLFDTASGDEIPAHAMSDGVLRLLGLLALLRGPGAPELLLIDELEQALHPRAMGDFILLLRRFLEQRPALRILATTHSPYLVEECRPEEVRLLSLDAQGQTSCQSMVDHPDYPAWRGLMTTAELWAEIDRAGSR